MAKRAPFQPKLGTITYTGDAEGMAAYVEMLADLLYEAAKRKQLEKKERRSK